MLIRFLIFAFALFIAWGADARPAAKSQDIIKTITVEGNQRIETETVKSFLKLHEGEAFNAQLLDLSLQNIYASGLFADVTIDLQGNNLIVKVVENPIINEISFEGNKRIKRENLEKELKLKSRSVYNKNDLQNDVKRILDIYHKSGRFSATVEPKIIKLDQNRLNLVFEINEGKKTEIGGIYFIGNQNFTDSKLRSIINTKETHWYRFFSSDDTYDADRLAYDEELLRRFYVSKGYADFRLISSNADLNPEKSEFYITFAIEEGKKYKFGKMNIETTFQGIDIEKYRKFIKTKEGETFNADLIEDTIQDITKELGNQGYAFVNIDPKFVKDSDKQIIGINYVIKEGPRVYIENINIHGNVRTLDKVIRREFRIAEGDPYNADKIRRSQQRIKNLGYFDKADIKNSKGSAPDKVNIDLDVEEKSTGELTFGAGFSTTDGALADIGLSERNLLGTGQQLRLNTKIAQRRQDIDLSYTEPYFLDKNLSTGVDLFRTQLDRLIESSFKSSSTGFSLRLSYPFNEHLTHSLKYTLRDDNIEEVDATASRFIRDQLGETITSMIGHSLLYDKTDNKFDPTEGYFIRFNQDFAGLGGDSKFIRNEIRSGYFYPTFGDKWVLKLSARAGYVKGVLGKSVNINNRFFLGGNDLRGFRSDGVGPHDDITGDALGGNKYYSGSIEHSFPLGLPDELGFQGSVFTDFGSLYDSDAKGPEVVDSSELRASAGVGVSWSSPLGPVRIDFADALVKNKFDRTEIVRFSFGTKF